MIQDVDKHNIMQTKYNIPSDADKTMVSEPVIACNTQPVEYLSREVIRQLSYIKEDKAKMQRTLDFLVALTMSERKMSYGGINSQLEALESYDTDWDGYGASSVSVAAIENTRVLMQGIECNDPLAMEIMPSHNGAVIFKYRFGNTVIRGEIGQDSVSFYVRRKGQPTEYHNDEPWNEETIHTLRTLVKIDQILDVLKIETI